jgi:hypothetical protein
VDEILQTAEQELGEHPVTQGFRRKLNEWALGYYQEFVAQSADDAEFQAELEATRDKIKKVLDDLALLEGSGHLNLLYATDVQEDLAPTADERAQLKALTARLRKQRDEIIGDLRGLTSTDRQARRAKAARANEQELTASLSPTQQTRLRQIHLQILGPMAFREPAVIAALGLTPEQQDRIKLIEADRLLPFRGDGPRPDFPRPDGPSRTPGGQPFGPKGRGFSEFWRADVERILAVLTDDQRTRWRELTGKPFVRRAPPFGERGPGGRFGTPPVPPGPGR